MIGRPNEHQVAILRWISDGCPAGEEPSAAYKSSALALQNRRLVEITKRGGVWRAVVTDAGRHYLEQGEYPTGHFLATRPQEPKGPTPHVADSSGAPRDRRTGRSRVPKREPSPSPEVDSPARVRARGSKPRGDALWPEGTTDPWDERVLISVKEAAWLLSLPENAIRQAATGGDVQRVFIGQGTTHYRIVYGSLLAWVNDMPREPTRRRWWY